MSNPFPDIKKIYFIGIGGIGISAVARMMLLQGKSVSGSESSPGKITEELEELGVKIFTSHDAHNIDADVDTVVYTIAIKDDNTELIEARSRGIDVISYPEMLGKISLKMRTVAISGTHGKTTTTAMVSGVLIDAGISPTVIVGSLLKPKDPTEKGSNFIPGTSDIFVVEACEYRRSFLNITPHVLIITNIDTDHLDYYKDLADIQSAFSELANKMTLDDYIVCDPNDENLKPVLLSTKAKIIDYTKVKRIEGLQVPGEHNIKNAQAAYSVGEIFNVSDEGIIKSLQSFSGTWRRFEYKGETVKGAKVYDDYGHHPTEIKATLQGARAMFPDKKIVAIFQPHLYSRTKLLFTEFSKCFSDADEVLIMPIYAAREALDETITSKQLSDAILAEGKRSSAPQSFSDAEKYLTETFGNDSVLMTVGAGDVYLLKLLS